MRENAVDILGIGAQKSATSWAAHILNLHPKVWIPRENALSGKEVMFWDVHFKRGLTWYKRIMSPPEPDMKSMDVSPGYSRVGPHRIRNCKQQSPSARIFFLMRNPIYRDWSSLRMAATRSTFDLANASFIDIIVLYDHTNVAQFTTYCQTIQRWKQEYGDQLLLALYDDILQDPHAFYERLCRHVQIDPAEVTNWQTKIGKKIFEGPELAIPEPMFEFLSKKYRPMIERLGDLIGRDVTYWLDQRSVA